jgi:hypothetical protein
MSVFKEPSGPSSADASPDSLEVGRLGMGTHRVRALSWILTGIGCAGLIFQFLQVEDHTPMLLYFTVWSAILTTIVWPFVDMTKSQVVRVAAQAGALGNVLSGIVYWAVLFPPNGPGKYLLTILANVTLHAVLPVVVLVRLHARPRPATLRWKQQLATAIYPLIYLVSTVASGEDEGVMVGDDVEWCWEGPAGGFGGALVVRVSWWCSGCRHSVVTSVMAARVEDSSTMALPAA